jgi:hypothetical protein
LGPPPPPPRRFMSVFAITRRHSSEVTACHTRSIVLPRWDEVNVFPVKTKRVYTLLWSTDSGTPYTIAICTESTCCWDDLAWLWYLLLCAVDRVLYCVMSLFSLSIDTFHLRIAVALSAVRPYARPSSGAKRQKTVLQLFVLFRTCSLLLLVRWNVHVDQTTALRFCTNVCALIKPWQSVTVGCNLRRTLPTNNYQHLGLLTNQPTN